MRSGKPVHLLGLVAALLLSTPEAGWSHTRLLPAGTLPPRNTSSGNKTGPCGSPRTASPTPLTPGQQLTVQWEETINHPGHFRIAFSPAADGGFDQNILADQIPHVDTGTLPREYSMVITVPRIECDDCTIQMIQVMTDQNPPTEYYSCADVTIHAVMTPQPSSSPQPVVSPRPRPVPSPVPVVPAPACN